MMVSKILEVNKETNVLKKSLRQITVYYYNDPYQNVSDHKLTTLYPINLGGISLLWVIDNEFE